MTTKTRLLAAALGLSLAAAVPAQAARSFWNVSYDVTIPVYTMRTYIGQVSPRGFNVEGRYLLTKDISIGLVFRVNGFNQQFDLATIPFPTNASPASQTGAISGPAYRYLNQWSGLGAAHYYLTEGAFRPYVGVALGGVWVYRKTLTADFAVADTTFHFQASPEVGAMYQVQGGMSGWGLTFSSRYNFTTASFNRVDNMSNVSLALGAYWLE